MKFLDEEKYSAYWAKTPWIAIGFYFIFSAGVDYFLLEPSLYINYSATTHESLNSLKFSGKIQEKNDGGLAIKSSKDELYPSGNLLDYIRRKIFHPHISDSFLIILYIFFLTGVVAKLARARRAHNLSGNANLPHP